MNIRKAIIAGLFVAASSFSGILPYTERAFKYANSDSTWNQNLINHWTDWKTQFASSGTIKATTPEGTSANVSEAQSYGMMLSVWFNDEATFKKIWAATKTSFWTGDHFAWKIAPSRDNNFAGDADQDILGALIFASALQDSGYWKDKTYNYKTEAVTVMTPMSGHLLNSNNTIAAWTNAGSGTVNPSYFEYHWYPVFKEFAARNAIKGIDWDAVRTATYAVLNKQPNASKGMARNWSNSEGGAVSANTGSKPTEADMGFDAIRVPWRVGLDNLWYHNPAAGKWCQSVWDAGAVSRATPGMYTVDGPTLWGWTDNQYEKPMTEAMWGACAITVKDSSSASALAATAMKSYMWTKIKAFPYFTTFDATPQSNYYAQTLGIFGSLVISGRSWNVWDDLMNSWTPPDTSTKVTLPLVATPSTVSLGSNMLFRAKWSKSAVWVLKATGKTSGAWYTWTGTADSLNISWNTTIKKGSVSFVSGETINVDLTIGGSTLTGCSATVTLSGTIGIQDRFVKAGGLLWNGSVLRVNSAELIGDQDYEVRVLDMTGRVLRSEHQTARGVEGGVEFSMARPSVGSGLQLLEVRSATGLRVQSVLPLLAR